MPALPRVQAVVLPILRSYAALDGVKCGSWVEDIDFRVFPMINIRRIGGIRNVDGPLLHGLSVIEMTAYGDVGLIETELLYEDALDALYKAHRLQTQTEAGYLSSIVETMGATQFSSLYQDSWRVQGLIELGIRPPRT